MAQRLNKSMAPKSGFLAVSNTALMVLQLNILMGLKNGGSTAFCIVKMAPAIIESNGTLEWHKHGVCHRDDGPAVVRDDGGKQWWVNGVRHREDGPAVIEEDEFCQWWLNGALHREDGPAIEYADGTKEWYLLGIQVSEEIVIDRVQRGFFFREHLNPEK